ncbi:hypothetical protein ATCC90586_011129 [Pythium insidiosum]|nr:hypothetical protein ATCC90586_011129 [Pythium insidiosum]
MHTVLADTSSASTADVTSLSASAGKLTPTEALQAAQTADLPTGVKLTGTVEPLKAPAEATGTSTNKAEAATTIENTNQHAIAAAPSDVAAHEKHAQEQWIGGGLGWSGWGGWGGWGGFGPYRFGYACGGLTGWAYPLGYWNAFGAGIYGGGCGLGFPYGGLFYC